MEELNINIFSKSDNLRLYIIENTIHIEEVVSSTIGFLLNVDWETSKSFGFSSSALSFNQKIQIIQDIKSKNKDFESKAVLLMRIRNKFAHVKSIDSFKKLFELDNNNEIQNGLNKYETNSNKIDDEEKRYKFYFFLLVREVAIFIYDVGTEHLLDSSKRTRKLLDKSFIEEAKNETEKLKRMPKII